MTTGIAQTVVYRHPCDCPTASRPLAEGEEPEHRFDVDGEPFPWLITERGARFVRHGDAYLVTVTIIVMDPDTKAWTEFAHTYGEPATIGGKPFPWIVTGPVTYVHDFRECPTLTLTFVANEVDTDGPIINSDDLRPSPPDAALATLEAERRVITPQGTSRPVGQFEKLGDKLRSLGWWTETKWSTQWIRDEANR